MPIGREDALHAGARVGRAADDLEHAVASVSTVQSAQPVGVGVLASPRAHRRRVKAASSAAGSVTPSTSRPRHGQLLGDLVERGVGLQMLLEPGQRELHRESPP